MKLLRLISGLLVLLFLLQACSFRSTQLDFLMSALEGEQEEVQLENLAWTLIWSGESYTVFPVFSDDGLITNFITQDGAVFIAYDNNSAQIIQAGGLLPDVDVIEIQKTDFGLEYSSSAGVIASHRCEDFAPTMEGENTIWLQECTFTDQPYTNEIRWNGDMAVTLLRFMIHPDYPMVSLTPNMLVLNN